MLIVSVSACKKEEEKKYKCEAQCAECVLPGSVLMDVCRVDYYTDAEYEQQISDYEAAGLTCDRHIDTIQTVDSDAAREDLEDDGYVCTAD